MTLQSMTGFARSEGSSGRYRWAWELRSVNGKGLDLRLRLPSGMEALETALRDIASKSLSRGNIQAGLSVSASETKLEAVVNRDALDTDLANYCIKKGFDKVEALPVEDSHIPGLKKAWFQCNYAIKS